MGDVMFNPAVEKVLNSKKVIDHHAIIPTVQLAKDKLDDLSVYSSIMATYKVMVDSGYYNMTAQNNTVRNAFLVSSSAFLTNSTQLYLFADFSICHILSFSLRGAAD